MGIDLTIFLLAVFLGIAAFFSCSETAFFNFQSVRVHHLAASGVPNARRIAKLKEQPERFLSIVLLGNNLCNTAITALSTLLAIQALGPGRQGLGVAIATGLVTIGLVIFGETAPKALGARHAEPLSLAFARLWEALDRLLFPVAFGLYAASRLVTLPFAREKDKRPLVSPEELRTLVRMGTREGSVEEAQAEMIHRAFRFGTLRAQEIMTPRTEIEWVARGASFQDFLRTYARAPHTRYPVHDEAEGVTGILQIQDVMRAFAEERLAAGDPVTLLTRPVQFYPETKPVDDLFGEMRGNGAQMALLVNEYGGVAGLLTLKQIVGEVVGRITDEEAQPEVMAVAGGAIEVDASMRLEEANERLALGLPEGDYDTLAGFVLSTLGHIPRVGEQVHADGVHLTVAAMEGVRIDKLRVQKEAPPA